MNNQRSVLVLLVVVILVLFGVYLVTRSQSRSVTTSQITPTPQILLTPTSVAETEVTNPVVSRGTPNSVTLTAYPNSPTPGDMVKSESGYLQYTPENFSKTASKRRVLFFYANRCPTCISADNNFKENQSRIPSDVALLRVNYNDSETDTDEKNLSIKYGITYQHTFVQIDGMGKVVNKWNDGQINELLTNLK